MKKRIIPIVIGLVVGIIFMVLFVFLGGAADKHAAKGLEAYEAGKYELAVEEFEKAIEAGVSEKKLKNIYFYLGNSYRNLDKKEEAIEAYNKSLEKDPKFYPSLVELGATYRLKGKYKEAIKCYKKALKISPNYADAYMRLGVAYVKLGEIEKAIKSAEKAVKLAPDNDVAHANLALVYAKAARFDDADASIQTAKDNGYKNMKKLKALVAREKKRQKIKEENKEVLDKDKVPLLEE